MDSSRKRIFNAIVVIVSSLFGYPLSAQINDEVSSGAIIFLSSKGLVQVLDPSGNVVSANLQPGAVLADGFSIKTGFSGECAVLFSNGTIATVEPRSQMKVSTFLQKSFEPGEKKDLRLTKRAKYKPTNLGHSHRFFSRSDKKIRSFILIQDKFTKWHCWH